MPLEQLLALALLAFVGSFTPGPNNMIATVTGANHGFRAALPHVFGVPFGFASMLIAGALGVAALLLNYPFIAALLKWAGIAYLLFNSWQLARPQVSEPQRSFGMFMQRLRRIIPADGLSIIEGVPV
jgi:threonine/homoserine/homoserine lactone efflux protein